MEATVLQSTPQPQDRLPCCYLCRFFSPGDSGTPRDEELEEIPEGGDYTLVGVCRRRPPELGPVVRQSDGEDWRTYGEWPRVMACDWCGEFEQRADPLPYTEACTAAVAGK